jgi:hypothetical protein
MSIAHMRASLLEYLRNLTPQILLFSAAIFTGTRLDFTRIELSNWLSTLIFIALLLTFFTAVIANAYIFIEAFKSLPQINERLENIRLKNPSGRIPLTEIFSAPFKNLQFLIESLSFILVFISCNVAVFLSAFKIVIDLISKTH